MDLFICTYPLILTYQYYTIPEFKDNLEFLTIWWSSFGTFTLLEEYAGIDNLPFYTLLKGGILVSMYSSTYRESITKHTLDGVTIGLQKAKSTVKSIIDEHFPQMNEYIKIPDEQETQTPTQSWFSWFSWFSRKSE